MEKALEQGNGSTLIDLQGLSKVFYTEEVETHALSDIHLDIKAGEFVSIAGPSGCGKTTLLSILGLLDSPTAGDYLLDGEPVANLTASQRAKIRNQAIGFIFQAFNLIGDLTVYENVELPLTYRGMAGGERKQRVHTALEQLLINLVRNAVDAALETTGGVELSWSVVANQLHVVVADEGPGLPVDTGNLFVPFYTTKPGGSGIGLALCRQIAEGHGGTLTLENSPDGTGARAQLSIPLDLTPAEPVATLALPPDASN